ncbi:SPFH domain-containing protein [Glutamicibacter halophytocola]|uniref:SPFH domain-containing protein n=1 Tax=Glutamicibacter halophytocola TaxID=1933880 RepID=A0ABX5Y9V7_9MICC|nr:SPFH domain-containing protein [Glutamicibacter halophytocola]QDY66443.1 SPFH domain-containing protein [Glutamicibacter halophytocola]
MFPTIFALFCALIGLVVMLAGKTMKPENKNRSATRATGIGVFAVSLVVLGIMSTTIVQPRTVGVKVALGKPTSVVSNGFHLKWPWEKVEKLDGSVQNDVYSGDSGIPVRLGNNGRANVDASIQWQLKTDDAMDVFLDYRTFEGIQSNLVDRNFRATLNEVMATYDPLAYTEPSKGGQDLEGLAKAVQGKMQGKVKTQIEIRSVTLPIINFDEPTQNRINELQAEAAKTRVAEQRKQTSTAEAEANKILERSLTPETLTSKCLDIVAESNQSPIGCFPNSGVQPITMTGDKNNK